MKKQILLSFIFVLFMEIANASGLHFHLYSASKVVDPLVDYYIQNSSFGDVLEKEELKNQFYLGCIFPDVYREKELVMQIDSYDKIAENIREFTCETLYVVRSFRTFAKV